MSRGDLLNGAALARCLPPPRRKHRGVEVRNAAGQLLHASEASVDDNGVVTVRNFPIGETITVTYLAGARAPHDRWFSLPPGGQIKGDPLWPSPPPTWRG